MTFPKNFLWGASTSAFQAEGAYLEDGKGLTVADVRSAASKEKLNIADTTDAVDFYHRYKEDIALMKECGFRSFRLSISWARIYPHGNGKVNQVGIDFYNNVFDELVRNEIEPIVTLYHFDLPMNLIEQYKGFLSRQCIDDFVNYAKTCFECFGKKVKYWLTINEQMVITAIPSFQGLDNMKDSYQAFHHMCLANAKVIKLYRSLNLNGQIGPCISYSTRYANSCHPEDVMTAYTADDLNVFSLCDVHVYGTYPQYFINDLKKRGLMFEMEEGDEEILKDACPDFFGLNWYCTSVVGRNDEEDPTQGLNVGQPHDKKIHGAKRYKNPYTPYSEYNWNKDGTGLRFALRRMYARYRLPLIITENGWSANESIAEDGKVHDPLRIEYFKDMVINMNRAIEDGVDLFGFNPWSFMDVLSSSQGMDKRYGIVYVDRDNQNVKEFRRIPKDSFYWYQKVIKENGMIE